MWLIDVTVIRDVAENGCFHRDRYHALGTAGASSAFRVRRRYSPAADAGEYTDFARLIYLRWHFSREAMTLRRDRDFHYLFHRDIMRDDDASANFGAARSLRDAALIFRPLLSAITRLPRLQVGFITSVDIISLIHRSSFKMMTHAKALQRNTSVFVFKAAVNAIGNIDGALYFQTLDIGSLFLPRDEPAARG